MLVARPRLHELVDPANSRTLAQLRTLDVDVERARTTSGRSVAIVLGVDATPSQRLLARALLDSVLRLDPLVTEVQLEGFEERVLIELEQRLPLELHSLPSHSVDYTIAIGAEITQADLMVDGTGWIIDLGGRIEDQLGLMNPVGPLAAAALGAGEVFKALFALSYPDAAASRCFEAASGRFSFFDYMPDGQSPALTPVEIDAFLVGAGGVAAGTITALGELGPHISGSLRLIDHDLLARDSLNRVSYARWRSAVNRAGKVGEAKFYLDARLANLNVGEYPMRFSECLATDLDNYSGPLAAQRSLAGIEAQSDQHVAEVETRRLYRHADLPRAQGSFKRLLSPRRSDRRYEVIMTALDDDDVRHEVQRELPRVLVDAATGRDANCRVERVLLGEWGCLGCTRHPAPARAMAEGVRNGECGSFPDEHAPSVSFLSALRGSSRQASCSSRRSAERARYEARSSTSLPTVRTAI
jgi:hypothetical protein